MDKSTLLDTLKSKSMTLSLEEIQEIMDEELNKNPEEMDAELIDLCADVLDKAYFGTEESTALQEETQNNEKTKTRTKRIKLGKIFLVAAVIVILFSIALPVSAKYVQSDASDKIVQFFSNHFKIDLRGSNQNAINHSDENIDLIKNLEDAEFENIILPSIFLEDDYSEDKIYISENELFLSAEIDVELDNNINGYIGIIKYKTDYTDDMFGTGELSDQYDSAKQITVNGMDVIVFSSKDQVYIRYLDNDTEYSISLLNCDLDSGVEIAKTLE